MYTQNTDIGNFGDGNKLTWMDLIDWEGGIFITLIEKIKQIIHKLEVPLGL